MSSQTDRMYPYVVPHSWVAHAGADSLVSWEVSSDVHVILVFDGAGTVRNVRPADLEAAGLNPDAAFELAAHNLGRAWHDGQVQMGVATLQDGVEVGAVRGSWMAPAAALILGNFHAEMAAHFGVQALVAVAVNQQSLFAFPADERTLASASLRIALDDESRGFPKPVSRQWLVLDGGWPHAYDGEQLF